MSGDLFDKWSKVVALLLEEVFWRVWCSACIASCRKSRNRSSKNVPSPGSVWIFFNSIPFERFKLIWIKITLPEDPSSIMFLTFVQVWNQNVNISSWNRGFEVNLNKLSDKNQNLKTIWILSNKNRFETLKSFLN